MAVEREVIIEHAGDTFAGMKISWGGVFGGVLTGIGTLLLLSSLGTAIGVSSAEAANVQRSTLGTGAAIWASLTLLIALFVGGWASTRLSMLWERTTAMFEGALVWVLSMILILYMAANGIGLMAEGAFGSVGQSAQQAAPTLGDGTATSTAWFAFAAMVLSLIAAIAGAAVGRRGVVGRVTGATGARG